MQTVDRKGTLPPIVTIIGAFALMAGCATVPPHPASDTAEAIIPVPVEQVRATVVQMLVDQGYCIQDTNDAARLIGTGYRQEIDSIWNGLLDWRFGVNRSRVDIALVPEGQSATLVSIYVTAEGKDSLFAAWRPYEASLPQSAGNQLRLLRNALGLLWPPTQPRKSSSLRIANDAASSAAKPHEA